MSLCHRFDVAVWCLRSHTVFDLGDISHHNLSHRDLDDLPLADDGKLLFLLDATLQPTELLLLGPVVEGRHQDHDDDRKQDGGTLDPASLGLALVLSAACNLAACCEYKIFNMSSFIELKLLLL